MSIELTAHILDTIMAHRDYLDANYEIDDGRCATWTLRRQDHGQAIEVAGRCRVNDEVPSSVASYRALYKACCGAWPDLIITGDIPFEDAREWNVSARED